MENIINKLKRITFLWIKYLFWLSSGSKNKCQERVFVGGMQRSGTNLLMDVLEKSYAADVYHERDVRAFNNYQMRDESVIHQLCDHSRAPQFIIKALCELQNLDRLMNNFKPAKTIWIIRDYHDVVSSMLKSFGNMENQILRILKENNTEWLGQGMTDNTRNELIGMAKPGIGNASASAMQWYLRNILFFDLNFDNNQQVLLISYEELVSHPEAQVKKICQFVGIEYHIRMVKGIFSSSIKRRKNPEINSEISILCDSLQLKFKKILEK